MEVWADITKAYSFLLWYMDSNRPLPGGKILDPYREKEYNLRKDNKFPPPLLRSNVVMVDFDGVDRWTIKRNRIKSQSDFLSFKELQFSLGG